MDIKKNIGQIDRTKFQSAHNDTLYCQPIFDRIGTDEIKNDTFAYKPCWAILDAGMKMEAHKHPIPEFYVFVSGEGVMRLGKEKFDVRNGMAVNIPRNTIHEVTNGKSSIHPLIWISVGLKE